MIAGTSIENFCHYVDYEYMCEELGQCEKSGDFTAGVDITNDLCDAKVPGDYCNSTDETVKACAKDIRSCLATPDFEFCDKFSELCFPMPETFTADMIPTISDDMKIEYGDAFFVAPH